jgi:glycyl-tRNA synthetase beta subunit
MSSKNLLVELFVEELPPKALKKLGEVFAQTLAASLKNAGLAASTATRHRLTPRRAVWPPTSPTSLPSPPTSRWRRS